MTDKTKELWLVECKNEKCGHECLVEQGKLTTTKCPACLGKRVVARTPERAKAIMAKRTLKDVVNGKESVEKVSAVATASPKTPASR